jgi:hypothetical protein
LFFSEKQLLSIVAYGASAFSLSKGTSPFHAIARRKFAIEDGDHARGRVVGLVSSWRIDCNSDDLPRYRESNDQFDLQYACEYPGYRYSL